MAFTSSYTPGLIQQSEYIYGTPDVLLPGNISGFTATFTNVTASGDVLIGTASRTLNNNRLYIKEGDAGTLSLTGGNTVAIESNTTNYLGLFAPDDDFSGIVMGSPSDGFGAFIRWQYDSGKLQIGAAKTNHGIEFSVGNKGATSMQLIPDATSTSNYNATLTVTGSIITDGTITGNSIVGTIGTATQGTIDHDSLANFVANEHIDHSAVSVIAGTGLTGGGTIAANRTLNVIGGTGVTANANDIAIGQDVATTANVLFNHITASGNISASSAIYANGLYINNKSAVDVDGTSLVINRNNSFTSGTSINRTNVPLPITLNGNVTASANISASGTVFAEKSLSGAAALPNSTFALAGGSTSAISLAMAVSSSIGQVLTGQATSENINAGQLVYKASNGRMGLADADATSTSTNLLGIALNTVTAGNVIDVLLDGVVTILSPYITAGSIGNPLYVDTTAGSITNTAPSGENDVVRIVGHYIHASTTGFSLITFKPDGTWVEL